MPVSQTAEERLQNDVAAEKLLDGFEVVELKAEYVMPAAVATSATAATVTSASRTRRLMASPRFVSRPV